MKEIVLYSHAKINLSLDILHKRADNYHEIESVMQEISLSDKLIFKEQEKCLTIETNSPQVPIDFHNLVYKVWEKMKLYTGIEKGLYIKIEKNIPVAAGLAGGSSNAAATFKAINKLWDLNLSEAKLMKLGKSIGADIPFCIMGGTALAKGIGEKLTPLKPFKDVNILICTPEIEICTAYAYSKLDLNSKRLPTAALVKAIKLGDIKGVAKNLGNKMERSIVEENPVIDSIKRTMIEEGALASMMSGSGPTVFGIFEDEDKMIGTKKKLIQSFPRVYACKTL